jgi:hypothetical protein
VEVQPLAGLEGPGVRIEPQVDVVEAELADVGDADRAGDAGPHGGAQRGEQVVDRPVTPADLIASFYTLLGFDLQARLPNPEGLDIRLVPGPDEGLAIKPLVEIM